MADSIAFRDCFSQIGTPLDERVRKLLDGLQHQLQLVFAVVARLVLAVAMTGDRVVRLLLDLSVAPLRLDVVAERVVRLVAQLWRRGFYAEIVAYTLRNIRT